MAEFLTYLIGKRPAGVAYEDATSLCQWLCTIRPGVPADIRLTKFGELADAFAELSKAGWIHNQQSSDKLFGDTHHHTIANREHWLEVIVRRFKKPDEVALAHGDELARELGFA